MIRSVLILAALTLPACSKAPSTHTGGGSTPSGGSATGSATGGGGGFAKPPPGAFSLDFVVASVNLADDCPDPAPAPTAVPSKPTVAPSAVAPQGQQDPLPGQMTKSIDEANPLAGTYCDQTAMQLQLSSKDTTVPVTVRVVRIELMDAGGKAVGDLTPRNPHHWDNSTSSFDAWDGVLLPGESTSVVYSLSSPAWDKILGGRRGAYGMTVRVSIEATDAAGNKSATTSSLVTELTPEPPVVT